eukprot:m.12286 g.12286  ORF g.12286 m.12286 type:complete len:296 (+) comp5816_c0_seq2:119-1006(+)
MFAQLVWLGLHLFFAAAAIVSATIHWFTVSDTVAWKPLQSFVGWGKHRPVQASSLDVSVPKSWFSHFYLSSLAELLLSYVLSKASLYKHTTPYVQSLIPACQSVSREQFFLILWLFRVQILRRVIETVALHTKSPATMSIVHYAVGIAYYLVFNLFLAFSESCTVKNPMSTTYGFDWLSCTAIILFGFASGVQFYAHWILYSMRQQQYKFSSKPNTYQPPRLTFPFTMTSSPHYTAEIFIYLSMALAAPRSAFLWLVVLFVLTNLSIGAIRSHRWYQQHHPASPLARYAIIPWVL